MPSYLNYNKMQMQASNQPIIQKLCCIHKFARINGTYVKLFIQIL